MINLNLFRGELGFTNDPKLVQALSIDPNTKILFVGDVLGYEDMIMYYQMITATCLSPDYNALALDVDGDRQGFMTMYFNQLADSPASATFIATILVAMHQGKNVLIFFPQEAASLYYPVALGEFFRQFHGIQPAWGNVPYTYDKNADSKNAGFLYYYELITVAEYLAFSTQADAVQYYQKIATDMAIPLDMNNQESIVDFEQRIGRYVNNMIAANQILISPFTISMPKEK